MSSAPQRRRALRGWRDVHKRCHGAVLGVTGCALLLLLAPLAQAFGAHRADAWIPEPLPPGFHVEATAMDGPVFADAAGHTLYKWPFRVMRNGVTGDAKGESSCTSTKTTTSSKSNPY